MKLSFRSHTGDQIRIRELSSQKFAELKDMSIQRNGALEGIPVKVTDTAGISNDFSTEFPVIAQGGCQDPYVGEEWLIIEDIYGTPSTVLTTQVTPALKAGEDSLPAHLRLNRIQEQVDKMIT